jgi:hypothetical protein
MKTQSILLALGGLATLAVAHPVDAIPDVAERASWMIQYCASTGLTGGCGRDADMNANVCGTSRSV